MTEHYLSSPEQFVHDFKRSPFSLPEGRRRGPTPHPTAAALFLKTDLAIGIAVVRS